MSTTSEQALAGTFMPGPREQRPRPAEERRPPAARLALLQGVYFFVSGLWPIFSLRTFEAITGPKREGWLVKTTGAVIANIGAALALAGARGKVSREIRLLGAASAASLAAIDFQYAGIRRRISPVYLLDGVLQMATLALWGLAALRERREEQLPPEPAFA